MMRARASVVMRKAMRAVVADSGLAGLVTCRADRPVDRIAANVDVIAGRIVAAAAASAIDGGRRQAATSAPRKNVMTFPLIEEY